MQGMKAIKIAKRNRTRRIASAAMNFKVEKKYKPLGDGNYGFFYAVSGDFDNAEIWHLETIAAMLERAYCTDLGNALRKYGPQYANMTDPVVRISTSHNAVYLYAQLCFCKEWDNADGEFLEIE